MAVGKISWAERTLAGVEVFSRRWKEENETVETGTG